MMKKMSKVSLSRPSLLSVAETSAISRSRWHNCRRLLLSFFLPQQPVLVLLPPLLVLVLVLVLLLGFCRCMSEEEEEEANEGGIVGSRGGWSAALSVVRATILSPIISAAMSVAMPAAMSSLPMDTDFGQLRHIECVLPDASNCLQRLQQQSQVLQLQDASVLSLASSSFTPLLSRTPLPPPSNSQPSTPNSHHRPLPQGRPPPLHSSLGALVFAEASSEPNSEETVEDDMLEEAAAAAAAASASGPLEQLSSKSSLDSPLASSPDEDTEAQLDTVDEKLKEFEKEERLVLCFDVVQKHYMNHRDDYVKQAQTSAVQYSMRQDEAMRVMFHGSLVTCYHNWRESDADKYASGSLTEDDERRLLTRHPHTPNRFSQKQMKLLERIVSATQDASSPGFLTISGWVGQVYMVAVVLVLFGALYYGYKRLANMQSARTKKLKLIKGKIQTKKAQ